MDAKRIPAIEEIEVGANENGDIFIKQFVSDQFVEGGEMWVVIPIDKVSTIIRFLKEIKKEIMAG